MSSDIILPHTQNQIWSSQESIQPSILNAVIVDNLASSICKQIAWSNRTREANVVLRRDFIQRGNPTIEVLAVHWPASVDPNCDQTPFEYDIVWRHLLEHSECDVYACWVYEPARFSQISETDSHFDCSRGRAARPYYIYYPWQSQCAQNQKRRAIHRRRFRIYRAPIRVGIPASLHVWVQFARVRLGTSEAEVQTSNG